MLVFSLLASNVLWQTHLALAIHHRHQSLECPPRTTQELSQQNSYLFLLDALCRPTRLQIDQKYCVLSRSTFYFKDVHYEWQVHLLLLVTISSQSIFFKTSCQKLDCFYDDLFFLGCSIYVITHIRSFKSRTNLWLMLEWEIKL